jgi:hypothetical protein
MNFEPMYAGALVTCSELVWQLGRSQPRLFRSKSSLERSLAKEPEFTVLLQRASARFWEQ